MYGRTEKTMETSMVSVEIQIRCVTYCAYSRHSYSASGNFETVLKCFNVKERKGEGNWDGMDTQKDKWNEEGVSS
jgi:hypothetical protein